MKLLDVTLYDSAANVALDDALVEAADAQLAAKAAECDGREFEMLRLWEPTQPMVVLGRSSRMGAEVNVEACREIGVDIIRRASGGATIVTGPGCLMYAVVLSYRLRPELRAIDAAHRFVLDGLAEALRAHVPDIVPLGTSDLAVVDPAGGARKVSGNSMRCRRDFLLYHGTLLYDFPLDLVGRLLRMPPRQPDYRRGRAHGDFVTNLPLSGEALRTAVAEAFGARQAATDWPREETARLAREKYATAAWTNLL